MKNFYYSLILYSLLIPYSGNHSDPYLGDHSEFISGHVAPYISPGVQIGYNFDNGFFYGFQISMGIAYFDDSHYIYSPSLCYNFKKYFNSKEKEEFIDFQMMGLADTRYLPVGSISVGFGIGRNIQTHNMRAKIYTWKLTCLTYDYEFKDKTHNFSIIPVFPIGDVWM